MKYYFIQIFVCYAAVAVNGKLKTRIANRGETAMEGEFPYQVSMQINGRHSCGGSLISTTHVLTAAHCVQEGVDAHFFPGLVTIEVGSTIIGRGTTYQVKRISYFAGYGKNVRGYILPNDIAMIHLASPVVTSNKVAIIKLPAPNSPPSPNSEVILSGFGNSAAKHPTSPILKKMVAMVTPFEQCYQYFLAALNVQVTPDKFCAARGPGYGACQGDSGGPMVDRTKTTLLGVVSAGDAQCSNGQPDTYTDVSKFLFYIKDEMNWRPGNVNTNPALDFGRAGRFLPPPSPLQPQQSFGGMPQPLQPCTLTNPQENRWNRFRFEPEYPQIPQDPRFRSRSYQQELMPCPPEWQLQQRGNLQTPFQQQPMDVQPSRPLPWNSPSTQQPRNSHISQLPNHQNPQQIQNPQNSAFQPPFPQQFQMPITQNYQIPLSQKPHQPWYPQ